MRIKNKNTGIEEIIDDNNEKVIEMYKNNENYEIIDEAKNKNAKK